MSKTARVHRSVVGVLVVVVALSLWLVARASNSSVNAGARAGVVSAGATSRVAAVVHPVPEGFEVKLLRAGLDARALAASGVTSGSILTVLQAAADVMNGAPSALSSADAAYASARVAADSRERKVQSGTASSEEVSGYAALKSTLASATSARQAILDGYFNAAAAELTQGQRAALTNIRTNRLLWEMAPEFLAVNRSEANFLLLREALSSERIAVELPDAASETAASLLTSVRAETDVAAAISAVGSNLASVTSAWNTAVGN